MRVVAHEQGDGTSVPLHSLEQPSPRRRSAAAIEATGRTAARGRFCCRAATDSDAHAFEI